MKKMLLLATLVAFAAPSFAGDNHEAKHGPRPFGPRPEIMEQNPELAAKMEAKQAEFAARREEMKARAEKLEKLVKEYKAAKDGSKKQTAARQEIAGILGEVREGQITMREEQIVQFEQRLEEMKGRLYEEKSPAMKQEWVDEMTQRVIEKDGDLREVLEEQGHMGKGGPGHMKMKGHKGPKGPHGKHPHFGPGHEDHPLPVPPPPPVEQ